MGKTVIRVVRWPGTPFAIGDRVEVGKPIAGPTASDGRIYTVRPVYRVQRSERSWEIVQGDVTILTAALERT